MTIWQVFYLARTKNILGPQYFSSLLFVKLQIFTPLIGWAEQKPCYLPTNTEEYLEGYRSMPVRCIIF